MAEEMGNENIFIFGMTVPEVEALKVAGYNAKEYVEKNAELAQIMEQLSDGSFSKTGNAEEFKDLKNNLMFHDRYLTFADYESYIAAQDQVNETYRVIWKISNFLSQTLLFCNFSGSSEMGQNGYSQCGVFGEIQLRPNYRWIWPRNLGNRALIWSFAGALKKMNYFSDDAIWCSFRAA